MLLGSYHYNAFENYWFQIKSTMAHLSMVQSQIAFMGPTWGPPGSCRPQMGPMLAPWALLSGMSSRAIYRKELKLGKSCHNTTITLMAMTLQKSMLPGLDNKGDFDISNMLINKHVSWIGLGLANNHRYAGDDMNQHLVSMWKHTYQGHDFLKQEIWSCDHFFSGMDRGNFP